MTDAATIQFTVLPSFSKITLADEAPIREALRCVLHERNRSDPGDVILKAISTQTGSSTVGGLRRLSNHEWRALTIPAICRIYLKHVVREAGRPQALRAEAPNASAAATSSGSSPAVFMRELEMAFNSGNKFDLTHYQANLDTLLAMGYHKCDAMEALCITDNVNAQLALEVLFLNHDDTRRAKRLEAARRLDRMAPGYDPATHGVSSLQLTAKLAALRAENLREQHARLELERKMKALVTGMTMNVYKEYVKGLLGGKQSAGQFQLILAYREANKISQRDHLMVLRELSITPKKYEAMRQEALVRSDSECVVCLEHVRSHVIMGCGHVCLCEVCVPAFSKRHAKCPLCSKPIKSIHRVYL